MKNKLLERNNISNKSLETTSIRLAKIKRIRKMIRKQNQRKKSTKNLKLKKFYPQKRKLDTTISQRNLQFCNSKMTRLNRRSKTSRI